MKLELNSKHIAWVTFILLGIIEIFIGWIFDMLDSNFNINVLAFAISSSLLWLIVYGLTLKVDKNLVTSILIINSISFTLFNIFAFNGALDTIETLIVVLALIYAFVSLIINALDKSWENKVFKIVLFPTYFLFRMVLTVLVLGMYGLAIS